MAETVCPSASLTLNGILTPIEYKKLTNGGGGGVSGSCSALLFQWCFELECQTTGTADDICMPSISHGLYSPHPNMISLSPRLPACLSVFLLTSLSLSLSITLFLSRVLSLSFTLSLSLSLSLSIYQSISIYLSIYPSLSFCLSVCPSTIFSVCPSVFRITSRRHTHKLSLYLSPCQTVSPRRCTVYLLSLLCVLAFLSCMYLYIHWSARYSVSWAVCLSAFCFFA